MASLTATAHADSAERIPAGGFRALWTAIGVSQLGSAVSLVTIPLIAATTLHASAGQMAWLMAANLTPSLLVRVPAAAWSDSLRGGRVPLMVAGNLLQAATATLIPLLWWLDALTVPTLLALTAAASVIDGGYASLASPVLVQVVPRSRLVEANGKIAATRSVADVSGPALGGALLAVLAAPLVILADAVSFLASSLLLTRVHPRRQAVTTAGRPRSPGAGALGSPARGQVLLISRLLVALVRRSSVQALVSVAFVNGVEQTVFTLFAVREVHLRPSVIGLLLSFGAVGGVCGGVLVGRILSRLGPGPTLAVGVLTTIVSLALLPFAAPGFSGALGVVLLELGGSFGGTLMVATVFGGLQGSAPEGRVSQVMAVTGTLLEVAKLSGVPVGGVLAVRLGLRAALIAAFGLLLLALVPQLARWALAGWTTNETELP